MHTNQFKKYIVIFLSVLACAYILALAFANGDFKVFTDAGKLIGEKKNIYNTWIYTDTDVSCLYLYSPLFAMLLSPFRYFPQYVPNLLWQIGGIIWTIRCWKLISARFVVTFISEKDKTLLALFSFLLIGRFLLYNFDMVQMTIFLLWSILESINLIEKNKNVGGSSLLALAINIKLLPVVIIPYLIYRMKFKSVVLTIVFSIALLFLPALFIGYDFNTFLLEQWWGTINPTHGEHLVETGLGVHSLTALIPSLLMPTEGDFDMKRNLFELSPLVVDLITNIIRLLFILLTLYLVGLKPRKESNNLQLLWEISYITLIIPLVFPHQQKYAFFLLFPAAAYITYFLIFIYKFNLKKFGKIKWRLLFGLVCLSFLLTTLTTDGLIGRHYNQITQHLKLVTYGTIAMGVVLTLCHPKYISVEKIKE